MRALDAVNPAQVLDQNKFSLSHPLLLEPRILDAYVFTSVQQGRCLIDQYLFFVDDHKSSLLTYNNIGSEMTIILKV